MDRPTFPARPSHPPGPTYLNYTPDGKRLSVAGSANFARSYVVGSDGEPDLLTDTVESNLAVVSGNAFMVLGSDDGSCMEYAVPDGELKQAIVRFTLPVRDLVLLKNDEWLAACSE
jgi:chromosome transmission fidelity protein 4